MGVGGGFGGENDWREIDFSPYKYRQKIMSFRRLCEVLPVQ